MNLMPTDEQEAFVTSSAAFLVASLPITRLRELTVASAAIDDVTWVTCAELGWFGLGLPEALGGLGAGLADEALLFRELGRMLAPGPFLGTVLAARLAGRAGLAALAGDLVDGAQRVGLAVATDTVVVDERVHGPLQLLDCTGADHAVVLTPAVAGLVEVAALDDVTVVDCLDAPTHLAEATAVDVPLVGAVASADDPLYRRAAVLTAAMQVGIAEATRDIAAEHAKVRVQFDRPIGVHQAVKHPCSDMAVKSEASWAQTVVAALSHDEELADAQFQALSALVVAGDAAEHNAAHALQILGGIGFTEEHDVHLYVTRGHVLRRVLGDRAALLDQLLDR
jgi:alkylation response protein AidB-like acyl-CoA dehydrogenase